MYILHSNITSLSALSLAFLVPFCFIILVRYSGNESRALVYRFLFECYSNHANSYNNITYRLPTFKHFSNLSQVLDSLYNIIYLECPF